MEFNITEISKDEADIELENITLAEILRVYLNEDSAVTFAAWRREHPTEHPILKLKTKGKSPKKAVADAIASISKELEKVEAEFKKLK